MRRIISLLLVMILSLTLVGCAGKKGNGTEQAGSGNVGYAEKVYADTARTYVEGKGEEWTLANTYKKLTQDKKLNVAYFGGSVTVGTGGDGKGSWRQLTNKWFSDNYPDAIVNEIYAAIGGTGSLWGLMRLERDVLQYNPDLVFVEFAMNDVYTGMSEMQAAANIDGIIRKINEHNPNTDIVLVFITSQENVDKDFLTKQGHRKVAEYYGVPYIDVGNAVRDEIAATGNLWDHYFTDTVHPNLNGYRVYYNEVERNIKKWLDEAKNQTPKDHIISKTPAITNPYSVMKLLDISKVCDENWRYKESDKFGKGTSEYISPQKGAKIELEIEGSTFAAYCRIKEGCKLKFTVDGEEKDYIEQGIDDSFADTILLDNLAPGKHKVTIEYIGPGMFVIAALMDC